ncbi:hypothetical protein [Natrinema caseinilyticum]|uniref:hypothetical protein n=1 Tax=Natrinema caseinilyticum TaxID=2961570 RepID=UPI0020C4387D|nr:hypothetical protein [Natrinema caseinilyticum]
MNVFPDWALRGIGHSSHDVAFFPNMHTLTHNPLYSRLSQRLAPRELPQQSQLITSEGWSR